MLASSRLRSFVEPPAPHVTLIASGFKADKREMRDTRFSKPYTEEPFNKTRFEYKCMKMYLICTRGKEFEGAEWPAKIAFRKLVC